MWSLPVDGDTRVWTTVDDTRGYDPLRYRHRIRGGQRISVRGERERLGLRLPCNPALVASRF